jgi:hypothetical protein
MAHTRICAFKQHSIVSWICRSVKFTSAFQIKYYLILINVFLLFLFCFFFPPQVALNYQFISGTIGWFGVLCRFSNISALLWRSLKERNILPSTIMVLRLQLALTNQVKETLWTILRNSVQIYVHIYSVKTILDHHIAFILLLWPNWDQKWSG